MPVTTHQIRQGETLSGIAKEYGFGNNWHPIMNLNVHKKLLNTNDERRIPAGSSILIPRTAEEYDDAIASLNDLLRQVDKDAAQSIKCSSHSASARSANSCLASAGFAQSFSRKSEST